MTVVFTVPAYTHKIYDDEQIIQAARAAGFPQNLLETMRCIAYAESSGTNAIQRFQPYHTTGWGTWQITPGDSVPSVGIDLQLLDLDTNARAAHVKWNAQGLGAWSTYNNGLYRQWENYHRGPGVITPDNNPPITDIVLGLGSKGPMVLELQNVLNAWYPWLCLKTDAIYGSKTAAAVADFQRRAGFIVNGIADGLTLRRLGIS